MEKAMTKNHRMSIADYEAKLANRIKVEKRREQDYQKSKQLVAAVGSQIRR